MDTRRTARVFTAVTVLTSLLVGSAYAEAAAGTGTWQRHQFSFVSMGFTSTYSCDGLADKLKLLLIAAGARADVKAQGGACPLGFGHVDKLARAELTFYTLIPDADAKGADGSTAHGQWRQVTLAVHSPRELGLGDCELVEQFHTQLLPMFAARDVRNQTTCVPHQDSGSNINLKFESFSLLPAKPAAGVGVR